MTLSEERLQQLALNKLRALSVHVYVADGVLLGRLTIDPLRFALIDGYGLAAQQSFLVQQYDRIQFVPPSPLSYLGEIPYFEVARSEDLLALIETRWSEAVDRASRTVELVRRLAPKAKLYPASWTIEAQVSDGRGHVHLSFDADGGFFRVVAIAGNTVGEDEDWTRGVRRLDLSGRVADVERVILGEIGAARRLLERAKSRSSDVSVDDLEALGIEEIEILREELRADELEIGPAMVTTTAHGVMTPISGARAPTSANPAGSRPGFDDPFKDHGRHILVVDTADLLTDDELPAPMSFSANATIVGDVDILFDDAVEVSLALAPPHSVASRPQRLDVDQTARISVGNTQYAVRIVQVNANGAFASMPLGRAPRVGENVVLGGFGAWAIRARVVHHRESSEAKILGTPEGIGLAWIAEDAQLSMQEGRFALLYMKDGPARDRAIASVLREGFQIVVADNLLAASVAFHHQAISLVVMDDSMHGEHWSDLGDSLDLGRREIPVVIVEAEDRPSAPCPHWAVSIRRDDLDARVIAEVSAARRIAQ